MSTISFGRLTLPMLAIALAALTGCMDRDLPTEPTSDHARRDVQIAATRVVTSLGDAGPGTLRQALNQAEDDDLIQFHPSLA